MEENYFFDKLTIDALTNLSNSIEEMSKTCSMENLFDGLKYSIQTLNDAHVNAINGVSSIGLLQESLRSMFRDININWEKSLASIKNISAVVDSTFKDLNFEKICNSYLTEAEKYDITIEDEQEIKDDIVDIINSALDEKTLENCEKKWHEKHPILFNIIMNVLAGVLSSLILNYITSATTKKDSNIYVDANNKSSIIINIPENTSITITDSSINYYYKIIYTDTESNNDIEGYISKRNAVVDN